MTLSRIGIAAFLLGRGLLLMGQPADTVCRQAGNWTNCGMAVKKELSAGSITVERAVDLGVLWGRAYGDRYDWLRKKGRVESSTADAEKIRKLVLERLDPVSIAKDKAKDAILKKYLPTLAAIVQWAKNPITAALYVFFNSSEIATDYDELRLMNDDLQRRLFPIMESQLRVDWRTTLEQAVKDAGPQLKIP